MKKLTFTRIPTDVEKAVLEEAVREEVSFLALKLLGERLPLRVCLSNHYYLGSYLDGEPCARDSQYFDSFEAADEARRSQSWQQRMDP